MKVFVLQRRCVAGGPNAGDRAALQGDLTLRAGLSTVNPLRRTAGHLKDQPMLNVRLSVLALASVSFLFAPCCPAGTYEEDFSGDPAARGWRACGNTELFAWSAADQAMRVTWDSSQTNSYFTLQTQRSRQPNQNLRWAPS